MKFPRNARIFRGHLDAAPWVAVFFLLVMFLALASRVYTPGVALQLPLADNLPGTDQPTITVAMDANGQFYFENQALGENELRACLRQAIKGSTESPTLIVQADKGASYEMLVRLTLLAREAGISRAWLATLPRPYPAPVQRSTP